MNSIAYFEWWLVNYNSFSGNDNKKDALYKRVQSKLKFFKVQCY